MPGTGGGGGRARLSATVASEASSSVGRVGRLLGGQDCVPSRSSQPVSSRIALNSALPAAARRKPRLVVTPSTCVDVERRRQPLQGRRPVGAMGDDLGDHRVVVGGHRVALLARRYRPARRRRPAGSRKVRNRPIDGRKPLAGSSA